MRGLAVGGVRLLARLLPAAHRRRFGDDMALVFAAQWRHSIAREGRAGVIGLCARSYIDLLRTALGMRFRAGGGRSRRPADDPRAGGGLLQDVRYAIRSLRATPGFTITAILTLALGIGANAAVFSISSALLFQVPPGIVEPDRVVALQTTEDGSVGVSSYVDFRDFEERVESLASLAAFKPRDMDLNDGGDTQRVRGVMVTGRFFESLGVEPAAGRLLGPGDDLEPDAHPVAVLSWTLWQSAFGGAPNAVGREIDLNGRAFTIVGVTPREFGGATLDSARPRLYVPMMMQGHFMPASGDLLGRRGWGGVQLLGRLAPGVAISQANAEVQAVGRWIRETYPDSAGWRQYALQPHSRAGLPPGFRGIAARLGLLLGAVSLLVLLVACVNVANLLLARLAVRRRELAVRQALGAGRGRLVRQLLIESTLLSLTGAGVGLALSALLLRSASILPVLLPQGIGLDGRVLAFALAVAGAATCGFGVLPVLRATRSGAVDGLRDSGDLRAGGRRVTARVLVAAQVALSMVLLVTAGLLGRTLVRLQSVDLGFEPAGVAMITIDPALQGYTTSDLATLYRDLLARAERLPGTTAAGLTSAPPGPGADDRESIWVEGTPEEELTYVGMAMVSVDYLRTLRIRISRGRDLTPDDAVSAPVVIVNAAAEALFAERFGVDIVGRGIGRDPAGPTFEVVGVTAPSKTTSLRADPGPMVYLPYEAILRMGGVGSMTMMARTEGEPGALATGLRGLLGELAPGVPAFGVGTLEDHLAGALETDRMVARLVGAAALLSLGLAVVGLYGLLSYAVSRRTGELGVRLALGARPRDVHALVIRQGVVLAATGAVIGAVGAFLASRLLESFLYGVSRADPVTYLGVFALLVAVAAAAAWIPARRATRVDPATALRAS